LGFGVWGLGFGVKGGVDLIGVDAEGVLDALVAIGTSMLAPAALFLSPPRLPPPHALFSLGAVAPRAVAQSGGAVVGSGMRIVCPTYRARDLPRNQGLGLGFEV
jgi:hypothetical protein